MIRNSVLTHFLLIKMEPSPALDLDPDMRISGVTAHTNVWHNPTTKTTSGLHVGTCGLCSTRRHRVLQATYAMRYCKKEGRVYHTPEKTRKKVLRYDVRDREEYLTVDNLAAKYRSLVYEPLHSFGSTGASNVPVDESRGFESPAGERHVLFFCFLHPSRK